MKERKGLVKAAYQALCAVALLHLGALAGLGGYLVSAGKLTPQRWQRLSMAWGDPAPTSQPATSAAPTVQAEEPALRTAETIVRGVQESEIVWRERERAIAELEQKQQAIRAELIHVSQKREAFENVKKAEAEKEKQVSALQQQDGYKGQLAIVSALAPKKAAEFLMEQELDDSARMLLDMDTRQAKKIVEAAKTKAEKARMAEILKRVREIAPGKADDVFRKGP